MSSRAREEQVADGARQGGVRDYNERLILSLIRSAGSIPGSELARRTTLSAQTVSVILRDLEQDGVLVRGAPIRGKVGKPRVPMALNGDFVWSYGIKVGRRSAEVALLSITGKPISRTSIPHTFPKPLDVLDFVHKAVSDLDTRYVIPAGARICGAGLAMPFEISKWNDDSPEEEDVRNIWRDVDLREDIARIVNVPTYLMNDATAACRAEHHLGYKHASKNYAYFFIGAFIGGGIVLDGKVFDGNLGNAGALGSIVTVAPNGLGAPLLDTASLHQLENMLRTRGLDPGLIWSERCDWSEFADLTDAWTEQSSTAIAHASLSACAVIDFEGVVIDGAVPASVRADLVARVRSKIGKLDARGLIKPRIEEGSMGRDARVLGAAYAPFSAQYFLDGLPAVQPAKRSITY